MEWLTVSHWAQQIIFTPSFLLMTCIQASASVQTDRDEKSCRVTSVAEFHIVLTLPQQKYSRLAVSGCALSWNRNHESARRSNSGGAQGERSGLAGNCCGLLKLECRLEHKHRCLHVRLDAFFGGVVVIVYHLLQNVSNKPQIWASDGRRQRLAVEQTALAVNSCFTSFLAAESEWIRRSLAEKSAYIPQR